MLLIEFFYNHLLNWKKINNQLSTTLGFVYKRFSKTLPANAPTADEKKVRINAIVDEVGKYATKDIEILFVDESHFSNQPYVSRGWFKCGEKK